MSPRTRSIISEVTLVPLSFILILMPAFFGGASVYHKVLTTEQAIADEVAQRAAVDAAVLEQLHHYQATADETRAGVARLEGKMDVLLKRR